MMNNGTKFIFSTILIIFMKVLNDIFFIFNHEWISEIFFTLSFIILFSVNIFLYNKYCKFKKYGNNKYGELINSFMDRWNDKLNNIILVFLILISATNIVEFIMHNHTVNISNPLIVYSFVEIIILTIIIFEILTVFQILREYNKIKIFFKKSDE